ncbi:2-iminoacetate synthase ThiH [Salisediminibacterium halotolerans]|uniref:2-iminoacetate synthase n=1 Tax=Salisediminibacterium halotolerans TaxID=517425 RepID=A0A1H9VY91_9BACI|nr:2-iminoacetate synthase ThiH [Salisediminibacterium haloalkalitolerans]SES26484.1 2-iminoacetate synthase [Salisediminibacterium haloalkalitolerans]
MSFYEQAVTYGGWDDSVFDQVSASDVERALSKEEINQRDYFALLSPAARPYLETMAKKAQANTLRHFGKAMQLFLPLYLSDYCVNICKYCSFSADQNFPRRRLTMDEVEKEAKVISDMGIKHIILLSGESYQHSSIAYLQESMRVLSKYFSSVGLEIQPLEESEYEELVASGVDGLTVYQEVYNYDIYKDIHVKGPKKNYKYRLDTPERCAKAGMRAVNVGALLGLDDWRKESFAAGMHAAYLQDRYLETDVSVSFPRIRPHAGSYEPKVDVGDADLVQAMLALRLFLPNAGITLSTRESPELRDKLLQLGVTKISASSSTEVGGYSEPDNTQSQFEISDERSVAEMKRVLKSQGFQPIVKDWQMI